MIELTQKKLREARFFLEHLKQAGQSILGDEPEAFEFYLSAFLSAARSVTFVLRKENPDGYESWARSWFARLNADQRTLCDFLKERRNMMQKEGSAETFVGLERVPVNQVHSVLHPALQSNGFTSDMPTPTVGRRVYSFDISGGLQKVTGTCAEYVELLEELVQDFAKAHC